MVTIHQPGMLLLRGLMEKMSPLRHYCARSTHQHANVSESDAVRFPNNLDTGPRRMRELIGSTLALDNRWLLLLDMSKTGRTHVR